MLSNDCVCPVPMAPSEALRKVIAGTLHVGEATALAKFATCAISCVLLGFPLLSKHGDLTFFGKKKNKRTQAKE